MPFSSNRHYWSRFTGDKNHRGGTNRSADSPRTNIPLRTTYHLAIESYIFPDLYSTKCGRVYRNIKGRLLSKEPKLFDTQICRDCLGKANESESKITIIRLPI